MVTSVQMLWLTVKTFFYLRGVLSNPQCDPGRRRPKDWSRFPPEGRPVVVWVHDESIFYANDRRTVRWVHKSETATLRAKGEGASLMVADFVSADYGWLRLADGKETARVLFRPGQNRDGYFENNDIVAQAMKVIEIITKHFPDEDHILVYDNATTHRKRAEDALSAWKMPKNVATNGKVWGVPSTVIGPNGKPVHGPDGKVLKQTIRMADGCFDGELQSLYFPDGHPQAGLFKGMKQILIERGLTKEANLQYECKGFKCEPVATACCCRRTLFNRPDFVAVESLLEIACKAQGVPVIFFPKLHCEISMIESCWGYSKRVYRKFPASSAESTLEANLLHALESVPIESMQRYVVPTFSR